MVPRGPAFDNCSSWGVQAWLPALTMKVTPPGRACTLQRCCSHRRRPDTAPLHPHAPPPPPCAADRPGLQAAGRWADNTEADLPALWAVALALQEALQGGRWGPGRRTTRSSHSLLARHAQRGRRLLSVGRKQRFLAPACRFLPTRAFPYCRGPALLAAAAGAPPTSCRPPALRTAPPCKSSTPSPPPAPSEARTGSRSTPRWQPPAQPLWRRAGAAASRTAATRGRSPRPSSHTSTSQKAVRRGPPRPEGPPHRTRPGQIAWCRRRRAAGRGAAAALAAWPRPPEARHPVAQLRIGHTRPRARYRWEGCSGCAH